jgi:hypothetical protein
MADTKYRADTGNWSNIALWDNGVPTNLLNALFDASSFTTTGRVVTVDSTSNCLNMSWTGATNTPTLATTTNILNVYGNTTLISAMAITGTTGILRFIGAGAKTLDTNTLSIGCRVGVVQGTLTLINNNLTITNSSGFYITGGTFATGNFNVTTTVFDDASTAGAKTLTLGTSTIDCAYFSLAAGGAVMTNNTHTINVSGTGPFAGAGLSYGTVNLNGTSHVVSGNNTIKELGLMRAGVQTITNTGATQTVFNMRRDNGIAVKTLVNGTYVNASGKRIVLPYMSISGCTFTPANMWYFPNSTDGGTNTGANFKSPPNGGGWFILSH